MFGAYESHCGSHPAPINKLIWNLKKSVAKRGAPEYVYKERAIIQVAAMLQELFSRGTGKVSRLFPFPPRRRGQILCMMIVCFVRFVPQG